MYMLEERIDYEEKYFPLLVFLSILFVLLKRLNFMPISFK